MGKFFYLILLVSTTTNIAAQEVVNTQEEGASGATEPKPEVREEFQCENGNSISDRFSSSCFNISWFKPSTRVYFDTGSDDAGEIDLFVDGSLNLTLELLSIAWHKKFLKSDNYSWGPILGAGLSTPAKSPSASENMNTLPQASSAPVFMTSVGLEFQGVDQNVFAEIGFSQGWTADESFGDTSDGAIYVGVKFNF